MNPGRPVFLAALLLPLFALPTNLRNGSPDLANEHFERARACFNRQEYFPALKLLQQARHNSPASGAPWFLAGHCLYLQGQDQAALFHYRQARDLNPRDFPLPSSAASLSKGRQASAALDPRQLRALRTRIGQMIMVSIPGRVLTGQKRSLLRSGFIGGVILFHQNVESKDQVADYIESLQENSPTPLFVAVDQEGGAVRRFTEEKGFQKLPSLAALGRTKDPALAYRFGLLSGAQLKEVGANLNLAPVVDLDHGLEGCIIAKYQRSLGGDPETVTQLAAQIVRGMRDKGVLATAKHFPTQSATGANPHERTAVTDRPLRELEEKDVLPYRRLIGAGLLDAVMLSHVVYRDLDPYFPASLSPEIVGNLLRGKLGFQGLVICDDLRMDAIKGRFSLESSVVQAVNAGVDILLVTDNMERRIMDALVEAVASGRVARSTVDKAYSRIMGMKVKYGLVRAQGAPSREGLGNPAPPAREQASGGPPQHSLPTAQREAQGPGPILVVLKP
jgi:beta-N-acetylhexosaminidase